MNKSFKIGFFIGMPVIALLLTYMLVPLKIWKAYKANHPTLIEVKDEATPSYLDFCHSYWKTFLEVSKGNEENLTYDGGELDEVIITAKKI